MATALCLKPVCGHVTLSLALGYAGRPPETSMQPSSWRAIVRDAAISTSRDQLGKFSMIFRASISLPLLS